MTRPCFRCGKPANASTAYTHDGYSYCPTCFERELWKPTVDVVNRMTDSFSQLAASLGMTTDDLLRAFASWSQVYSEMRVDGLGWVRLAPEVAEALDCRMVGAFPSRIRHVDPKEDA